MENNINKKNLNTTTDKLDLNNATTMGERIRALRKKRGTSQETLSGLLCVDKTTVSRWETGDRTPAPEMITALAEEFKVTPYYLMFGHKNDEVANLIDLNGLTFSQQRLIKSLVEEFRKSCQPCTKG